MKTLICTKHVNASPETVFSHSTAIECWPDMIQGIDAVEKQTEGPFGLGTRFKETRVMFGREATEVMTVVSFESGRSYAVEAESHGNKYHTEFRFLPDAGGTRIEMEFRCEPQTFSARLIGAVMGRMMAGTMVKMVDADLEDIKRAAEGSA